MKAVLVVNICAHLTGYTVRPHKFTFITFHHENRTFFYIVVYLNAFSFINFGHICYIYFVISLALQPSAGYGLLIHEVFLTTHNDALQSVGLLWTSDQLVAETST
jgi:hypothetical protein